jgi:hypothetical protein
MNPSHKCCNNTNNNVINTLSKLKLHVEYIPVQHLGSIWMWEPVLRPSSLAANCAKAENEETLLRPRQAQEVLYGPYGDTLVR